MNDRNDASSEKARREAELAAMTKARQQGLDAEVEDEQRRRDEARSNAGVPSAPSRAPVSAPPIAPPPVSSPAPPPVVDNRAQEEEEARRQQEEEDRERQRKESEDRARKEAEDRARKESEDRARREAEDRSRKEAEERARKDEEARKAAQAASAAAAAAVPKSSGIKAKAVYDYDKAEDNEISFADGEIITDIEKVDDGWWKGKNSRGEVGLFPATYVEEMASAPVPVGCYPGPTRQELLEMINLSCPPHLIRSLLLLHRLRLLFLSTQLLPSLPHRSPLHLLGPSRSRPSLLTTTRHRKPTSSALPRTR